MHGAWTAAFNWAPAQSSTLVSIPITSAFSATHNCAVREAPASPVKAGPVTVLDKDARLREVKRSKIELGLYLYAKPSVTDPATFTPPERVAFPKIEKASFALASNVGWMYPMGTGPSVIMMGTCLNLKSKKVHVLVADAVAVMEALHPADTLPVIDHVK